MNVIGTRNQKSFWLPLISGTICITLLLGVYGLWCLQARLIKNVGETLSLMASHIASTLDRELHHIYGDMEILVLTPLIQGNDLPAITRHFAAIKQSSPLYHWIGIAEPEGQILASTDGAMVGKNVSHLGVFQTAHDQRRMAIHEGWPSEEFGEDQIVAFAIPPIDPPDVLQRILLVSISPSSLEEVFDHAQQSTPFREQSHVSIEWQLITQSGQPLLSSVVKKQRDGSLPELDQPSVQLVTTGNQGFIQETHPHRDVPVLTGFASTKGHKDIPGSRWGVQVSMDQKNFLPPIQQLSVKMTVVGGMMVLPLWGLLWWTTRRCECEKQTAALAEAQYRSIFEKAKEGIFQTTAEGQYFRANTALASLFGFQSPQELIEHLTLLDQQLYTDPTRRTEFQRMIKEQGSVEGFVSQIIRQDGTLRWISENAHAVHDAKGDLLYYEGTVEDITEQKQTEEDRDRFFSLSLDILCIARPDGFLKRLNPVLPKILGFTPQALLSRPFFDFVYPDDRVATQAALQQLVEGQEVIDFENRYVCHDGSTRWIQWRATPVDEAGLIYAVARDVTERKLAEDERLKLMEQLSQAQKLQAVGSLASGIAHDFNNILTAIIGYTDLARICLSEKKSAETQLREVLVAGQRGRELVKQILSFSRQEKTDHQPVKLQEIIEESLTLVRATLPPTIEIRQHNGSPAAIILADSTEMYRVLMNLCTNASQAMADSGGVLEVNVDEVETISSSSVPPSELLPVPHIRLTVRDTGIGMPPGIQDHIFDPFFTTKNNEQGTGLGLSVVHGIISNHGGTIHVESAMGTGTAFQIYLPIHKGSSVVPQSLKVPTSKGQEHILFIDDDEALCHLGKEILEHLGYQVLTQTCSLQALEVFRQTPQAFDLVMTDDNIPAMTGQELIGEFKKIKADIPIILCSGSIQDHSEAELRRLGIQARLFKPIGVNELAESIRQVLDATLNPG